MKHFTTLIIVLCCILLCCHCIAASNSSFIPTKGLEISSFIDDNINNEELLHRQELAHTMAECARGLGYNEDHTIVALAKTEWNECEEKIQTNKNQSPVWNARFEEYPYATYVWLYLTKKLGYSDYVAAGILGNMMAEVGGQTLNLEYWLYSSGGFYYGLCQWGKTWFPEVQGMDLMEQCDYLAENIEQQINEHGKARNVSNAFNKFLQSTSCRDAALMFAKWYEVCGSSTYSIRQDNAEKAYKYFTTPGLN